MADLKSNITKYRILLKRTLAKNPVLNSMSIKRKINEVSKLDGFEMGKDAVSFRFNGRGVKFLYRNESDLEDIIDVLKENFAEDQYKNVDVHGRDVVDIGSGIGDTPLYFALKGAKHVYAFEPFPYRYDLSVKNIAANRIAGRVTLLNEGCGGKDSRTELDADYRSGAGSSISLSGAGTTIKIRSLAYIVKRFGLDDAVLKVDCEGCEYDVLLKSDRQVLRRFSTMIVEYHYGHERLVEHLKESGFDVKHTAPRRGYSVEEGKHMRMGLIVAKRS